MLTEYIECTSIGRAASAVLHFTSKVSNAGVQPARHSKAVVQPGGLPVGHGDWL
jgi:hypothetical protein